MVTTVNFILYQTGWFACVLGAASTHPWMGVGIALVLVGVHMALTTERLNQGKLLLAAVIVGIAVDSTLLGIGVYEFPRNDFAPYLPPPWMSVLWMQFATTFQYCLRWLTGRYLLSGVMTFIGAPLAFLAGERLGAVTFLPPRAVQLLILSSLWCVAIPALIYVSDQIHANCKGVPSYRWSRD